MSKVYLVTDGDYSDYHIEGIFSTREKAEEAQLVLNAHAIEEWELDQPLPDHPPGRWAWTVIMNARGESRLVRRESNAHFKAGWFPEFATSPSDGWIHFRVWAKDEQHAVKIANEQRTMLIALGRWTTDAQVYNAREKTKAEWKGLAPLEAGPLEPPR